MKKPIIIWAYVFLPCFVYSQFALDTARVNALVHDADLLRSDGEYHLADSTADIAIILALKIDYRKGAADAYMQKGRALKEMHEFRAALRNYGLALFIRKEQLKDRTGASKTYNSMSSAALESGEYQLAGLYSRSALAFCPENDLILASKELNNYANALESLDSTEKAINVNRQAIQNFDVTKDVATRIESGYGISKRLLERKLFNEAKREIDQTIDVLKNKVPEDSFRMAQMIEMTGMYFMRKQPCELDSAINYLLNAASIYRKHSDNDVDLQHLFFNAGEAYRHNGDLPQARMMYDSSMVHVTKNDNYELNINQLQALIELVDAQMELEKSYSTAKKLWISVFVLMAILTILSFALYLNARSNSRKDKLLLEKEKENSRLKDLSHQLKHDIVKNGLMTINNHLKSEMHDLQHAENGYAALKKMEDMVARMLNRVGYPIEGSNLEPETIKPFVRELHLRATEIFRGAQNYSFLDGVDDYRISQSLREQLEAIVIESFTNIQKYAACTTASLNVEVDENGLTLTIEDDGKGFDPTTSKKSGLRNIELRAIEIGAKCTIRSESGKGTTIMIRISSFPERFV